MPDILERESDPLSEFEPEPKGRRRAPLRRDDSADLSNALFQFLPERKLVTDRDQIRASGLRAKPSETAPAPSSVERFRRTPLAAVPFDRSPIGRVSSAALNSKRRFSVRPSPILLVATVAIAIVGAALGLRGGYSRTPAEITSMAERVHGSDELPPLPLQVQSANEPVPAETPFTAAFDSGQSNGVDSSALPTSPPDHAQLSPETTSPASSVSTRVEQAPTARVGQPATTAITRPPSVTDRSSLAPPFHGSLEVTSFPEGARVLLNGVLVGVTPLLLADLPIGSRAVRIELEGYKPWSSLVRIIADEPTRASAELQPSQVQ